MAREWLMKVVLHSMTSNDITKFICDLKEEYQNTLNLIMTRLTTDCPLLEYVAVGGYSPYGIHVKMPNMPDPSVIVAVIPQKRKGILVRARKELAGFKMNADSQLRWEKTVEECDFETVVRFCKAMM